VEILDIATILGLILGIAFFLLSIIIDKGIGGVAAFWNAPSVMVAIGGSIASTFISFPLPNFINGMKAASIAFKAVTINEGEVIKNIINLSNVARKEGLLALEEAAEAIEDSFLRKGILLIVDGTDPDLVRNILETELSFIEMRHKDVKAVWEKLGELAPAWGMIGTLIGLINMLGSLDDPAAIGPAMAIALLTTMYGSLMANFICIPFAGKLGIRSAEELLLKEVMIEGLLSIQAGENPRVIEEKLKAFLAPAIRAALAEAPEGESDGE
jgi:chemotaxis protein MotA